MKTFSHFNFHNLNLVKMYYNEIIINFFIVQICLMINKSFKFEFIFGNKVFNYKSIISTKNSFI